MPSSLPTPIAWAHAIGVGREDGIEVVRSQMHRLKRLGMAEDDIEVIGAMYGVRSHRDGQVDVDRMIGAAARLTEASVKRAAAPIILSTSTCPSR